MKKSFKCVSAFSVVMISLFPVTSFAWGDAAGWAIYGRQLTQMNKTALQAEQQYNELQAQAAQLKKQYAAVTGNYGWGSFENSAQNLTNDREWAPSDWKSALKGMSGGNAARYQQLLSQYKASHKFLSTQTFEKGKDDNLATSYQNQVQTNQASGAQATHEFNDINTHLKALYQLGQQIENAKQNHNLKSAVDLNTRVELEVGYISVEELRMQTLLNQQEAQRQSSQIASENEGSLYNQAGESK